jgi:hypothetical protein
MIPPDTALTAGNGKAHLFEAEADATEKK